MKEIPRMMLKGRLKKTAVRLGPLTNRHQDYIEIRSARNVLGETSVRGHGERAGEARRAVRQ